MDLDGRMSLLLQIASCFLAFLSGVKGASKSVEKVLVDSVQLKTEKEMYKESLSPMPILFYLPVQLSGDMFLPISSAWIKGTEEYVLSSQGDV